MPNFRNLSGTLAVLIIVSLLLPNLQVGSTTSFGFDQIVQVFTLPILFLLWPSVKNLPLSKDFIKLSVLLFLSMTISEIIGQIYFLDKDLFTLRPIFIPLKLLMFIFFTYVSATEIIKLKLLLKIIATVFFGCLIFGVLQFLDIGIIRDLSIKYYVMTDTQEKNFLYGNRVFGTTGMIISWAGLCILMFYFFLFLCENKLIKWSGVILAIFNVLTAGSRSGIVSLIISILIVQLFIGIVNKKGGAGFVVRLFGLLLFFIGVYYVFQTNFPDQIEFLTGRFEKAEEALTVEGRGAQLVRYLGVLQQDPMNFVFGIGSLGIRSSGYMEIDPAFILVSYGIIGFILHYFLLYVLLKRATKMRNFYLDGYFFIVAILIGSLIFSLGFFFLHEIYVGMPFWWLSGIVIGSMYRKYIENKDKELK